MSTPRGWNRESVVTAWQRFWFQSVPPHSYALLRIGFGLSGLAILLIRVDLAALWDLSGFVPVHSGWIGLKSWLPLNDPKGIAGRAIFVVSLLAFTAMSVGIWSRVSVPLSFAAAMLQYGWNPLPMSGADAVLRAFLFCLLWTDSGAVWSVDAWRSRRGGEGRSRAVPPRLSIGPLRLVQWQLALVYSSAGLWKLQSAAWRDGSAVYYVLNSNLYQRFPDLLSSDLAWVTTGATYATLVWELTFAPLVIVPLTRRPTLMIGAAIHAGMFLLMEVGAFHLVMLTAYAAFLDLERPPWTLSSAHRA